jgi:hypothetical protein
MLQFKNFIEVYNGFKEGKVPFCILQESAKSQASFLDGFSDAYDPNGEMELQKIIEIKNSLNTSEEDSFIYNLGGDLFICETEEDLKSIEGCDFEWAKAHDDKWPNVTDKPMVWDHCDYVNRDPASGWFVFLLCWNNAGGPIYYVPQALWETARVEEHLKVHIESWKTNSENY